MKLLMKLVMIVIVVLVVLVLAHNVVIKAAMETATRVVTGMPLSIQKFDLNIVHTFIDIEGLLLKNPAGFHDTPLVDIPKILVAYQRAAILTGKLHFKNIEFDMKQFTVVRNEKGELNLDRLRALQGTQKPSAPSASQQPKAPAKPIPIQIDIMHLKIGKVVYMDYSGEKPSTQQFFINLDQTYENITDVNSVVRLIVLKAMVSSGIANLVNFDISGLQGTLTGAFDTSTKMAAQAASRSLDILKTSAENPGAIPGQVQGVLKDTTGVAENTVTTVTGGVKSTANSLKNKLKLSF